MAISQKPYVYIQTTVTKDGRKKHRVRAEHKGRRLPSIPCGPDHAKAKMVRARLEDKLWNRRLRLKGDSAMTVPEFAAEDLARRRGKFADSTVDVEQRALGFFGQSYTGRLCNVEKVDVEAFEKWLRVTPYRRGKKGADRLRQGNNGIQVMMRSLKAALRRAMKEGLIDTDPFFGYVMPPSEDVANPPSDDSIAKIWEHLPLRTQRVLLLKGATGMRRSEVLSVERANFRPPETPEDPWMVRVQKAKTRRGKVEFKEVAVPTETMNRLLPLPETGRLFKMHPSTLNHDFQKAVAAAGLERTRPHDLRHRWATEFMDLIGDKYALRESGGWASDGAMSRYQHSTRKRRVANATAGAKIAFPPHALPTDAGNARRKTG